MIEVTDEMIYAFAGEPEITGTDAHCIRHGLTAVLAVVEREQKALMKREWNALQQCPSDSPTDGVTPTLHCERETGHGGEHRAMRYLTSWRDQVAPHTGSNGPGDGGHDG